MKRITEAFSLAVLCTAMSACSSTPQTDPMAIEQGKFTPNWESFEKDYQYPEWFRDAKFGIWAHWGVQCVPQYGDWYARGMYEQGSQTNLHHVATYGHPSEFGFMEFIPRWKADKWEPEKLMELYKKAGAKYFVAMANHHDNFDNYDSKYQPWNSVNMGPKRDLMAGWEKAARNQGLYFGVSNHAAHAWHWYQVAYSYDAQGDKAGVRYDAYHLKAEHGKGKWWEGYDPQLLYTGPSMVMPEGITSIDSANKWRDEHDHKWVENIPQNNVPFARNWFLRTKELLDKYKPDLLYFDDEELPLEHFGKEIVAHYYNTSANANQGVPQVVVTAKMLSQEQQKGVALDCERGSIAQVSPYPWQTCSCIGAWHYDQRIYDQNKYKSVELIIKTLVDIVSKNGNLLLSIPVKGDGSIDEKEVAFLEGMGRWMDVNGVAIYGSRPWKIFGEGLSNTSGEGSFGERERAQASLSYKDVRFTVKEGKLYVFFLGFPTDKLLRVRTLGANSRQMDGAKTTGVKMLGADASVQWEQSGDALSITMPQVKNTGTPIAFEITGEGII